MKTHVEIDDDLLAEAMKVLNVKTKKETIHKALQDVIRRAAQINIANMKGKVEIWDGYYEEDGNS